jgi:hypothetical protein
MDEENQKLSGREGARTYDMMRSTDAQVNATLLVMELPIRNARRYVEPAFNDENKSEDIDLEIAKFVENNLFETMEPTWDDFLRECLTMLAFGYSVFEKVYGFDEEKKIILKKL